MNRSALTMTLLLLSSACGTRLQPRVAVVDGRRVELATAGSGEHTVVFEAGLGSDWSVWDDAADEVARSSRVFTYSRPGYGRSSAPTSPRSAPQIVEELRAVLRAEGYPPPYVLVGHSFGGAYVEYFARAYPDEVTALVMVDPRPADFTRECEARGITGCGISPSAARSLPRVEQEELAAFADLAAELREAGGLGSYPVRVLTATTHGQSAAWEGLWKSMLGSLAGEAENGEQLFLQGGHNLQVERPRDVARIVDELTR